MGVGGPELTFLLCALAAAELQRVRAAPSFPPPPDFPKAESGLGSQGLQGRPAVSHPGSKRGPALGGRSQEKLSRPGMAVHPHPFPSGSGGTPPRRKEPGISQASLCASGLGGEAVPMRGLGSPRPLQTGQRLGRGSAKSITPPEFRACLPRTRPRSRHWGGGPESSLQNWPTVSTSPHPHLKTFLKGCGLPYLLCDPAGALFICKREWIT